MIRITMSKRCEQKGEHTRYVYVDMNRGSVSTIPIDTNESTPIDTEISKYIPITYHCFCIIIDCAWTV